MARSPQSIRKQLNDKSRNLFIFEDRFIKEQGLKEISEFHGLSISQVNRIIKHQKTRYEYTYNLIRQKIFKLPPVEITRLMMKNPDILVATESWLKLQQAVISYFLERTYPGTDV